MGSLMAGGEAYAEQVTAPLRAEVKARKAEKKALKASIKARKVEYKEILKFMKSHGIEDKPSKEASIQHDTNISIKTKL